MMSGKFIVFLIVLFIGYYFAIREKVGNKTLKAFIIMFFFISGFYTGYYYFTKSKERIPTAEDLINGKVKVEVVSVAIDDKVIKKDTTYTLIN